MIELANQFPECSVFPQSPHVCTLVSSIKLKEEDIYYTWLQGREHGFYNQASPYKRFLEEEYNNYTLQWMDEHLYISAFALLNTNQKKYASYFEQIKNPNSEDIYPLDHAGNSISSRHLKFQILLYQ